MDFQPRWRRWGCESLALWGVFLLALPVQADWPTYRNDPARSGFSHETVDSELHLQWVYQPPHPPARAWPRSQRLTFDRATQTVIADGTAYFGDSVTGDVIALDVEKGDIRWTFPTEGPVRFAPTIWRDRIFVVSDDGFLRALAREDGTLLWKRRGGPDHSLRLGNERMISRWPARGGPVVVDDTLYFAAGIWPSEGIFIYALDPENGEIRWQNDDSGSIYMPQPHGGANAESGVSAQGYLVAIDHAAALDSADAVGEAAGEGEGEGEGKAANAEQPEMGMEAWLLIPTGRAVPAAFDRIGGELKYFHLQKYGQKGGSSIVAAEGLFFNGGMLFDLSSGDALSTVGLDPLVPVPGGLVQVAKGNVAGYRWIEVEQKDRRGNPILVPGLEPLWNIPEVPTALEAIVAGSKVILGGDGEVAIVDGEQEKLTWSHAVEGTALGLAVSNGWLLVSTDEGLIYGFASEPAEEARKITPQVERPAGSDPEIAAAAREILQSADLTEGFCLDLGCGDGELACELARNSKLQIIAIDEDREQIAVARRRAASEGLLGSRITFVHVENARDSGLPNYFADLIVSQRALLSSDQGIPEGEAERLLRPYGGVSVLGPKSELARFERGELEGAGNWTHLYCTPGNSTCSTDELVKGPLGMLWYRDIDVQMPQRHGRGPGPLFFEGRIYSQGLDELACVDAYNGRLLWKYPLPGILKAYDGDELMGVAGTHGNYCVAETGVYVRRDNYCLRIDRETGELLGKFLLPSPSGDDSDGPESVWGYLACDGRHLIGTIANPEHVVTFRYLDRGGDMSSQLTESSTLFVLDPETGELQWRYDAQDSIRHNAIAVGSGAVYLIDRPLALFDRTKNQKPDSHPTGILLALDLASGDPLWENTDQIDGTLLALSPEHDALLMGYQPTRFALESELGNRIAVFDAHEGTLRWDGQQKYASRPVINDRTIYAQGGAWDLLTGESRPFNFSRSYGCGILAGSRNMMVFRSATLGYFDLTVGEKTENFGGVRPGCWINAIPAGGLVLVPDASAGCVCSYLNQSWFALQPESPESP
jgi:outer membrane protein assembly factor BamB